MKYNIKYKVNGDNPPFNVKLYENVVSGTPVAQMNVIEVNKFQYFNDIDFTKKYCLVATDNLGYSFDLCYEINTYEIYFASINGSVRLKYYNENRLLNNYESVRFLEGVNIEISAEALSGYKFIKWVEPENVNPLISGSTSEIETFVMPNRNLNISPYFERYYSGSINENFNVGIGADRTIRKIIKNSDSKYVLVGDFIYFNGDKVDYMVTLNENGSRVPVSGGMFNDIVTSIIEDLDGNYVIGGSFTTYAGQTANRIIKVNRTMSRVGVLDFAAIGFNGNVEAIIQDSNGKYVIVGNFTSYTYDNGTALNNIVTYNSNRIIRLNINGFPDNTFNVPDIFDYTMYTIIQDNDGNYVVGGIGDSDRRMVKLNQNGEIIDDTYVFSTSVNSILEDGDSYLVGGTFNEYNGLSAKRLIKINNNGIPSSDFTGFEGFTNINNTSIVRTIIKDSNDNYIIGGEFDRFGGEVISNDIIRLNIDGSIDNTFIGGYGFDGNSYGNLSGVYDILEDGDSYLVCGGFETYQGETVNRIVKIYK